jgi:hypothetical protein
METPLFEPRCAEFRFPQLDTLVRVEVSGESVTIRATRDTFSPQRKDFFVRELAAEGFIPDQCRWSSLEDAGASFGGVRWLVDHTWRSLRERRLAKSRRLEFRWFAVGVVLLSLLLELGIPAILGYLRVSSRSEKAAVVQMPQGSAARAVFAKASESASKPGAH